jgi:photosystem II stability/assembly factor-like uncharacterized protein
MAEGFITRRGGASALEITGQQVITGEYAEAINKFDTVFGNEIPAVTESAWDTNVTKLPQPSTIPTNQVNDIVFTKDDVYMAVSHANSPFLTIYKRDGDTFTKLPNPSIFPPDTGRGVSFTSDGIYLAVTSTGTPSLLIYKRDGDTFTKLPNPSVLPTFLAGTPRFSPDDNFLSVISIVNSPFLVIYKKDGDNFNKIADPSVMPTSNAQAIAFSLDNNYMAVSQSSQPEMLVYKRNGDNFTQVNGIDNFGGSALLTSLIFSNNTDYLIAGANQTERIRIWKRNGDDFINITANAFDPNELPQSGSEVGVDITSDDLYLSAAHGASPYLFIYKRDGDTFNRVYEAPVGETPPNDAGASAFSNNDLYLALGNSSTAPHLHIYKTSLNEVEPPYTEIVKANNSFPTQENTTDLGYALEDGTEGQEKTMMSLFRKE